MLSLYLENSVLTACTKDDSIIAGQKTIWIIEDNPGCRFVYRDVLGSKFKTVFFEGLDSFDRNWQQQLAFDNPSLLISDLHLDDGTFVDFLSKYNSAEFASILPFIVVSVIDDLATLEYCREKGAIDYITKPFNANELIFRVQKTLSALSEQEKDDALCTLDSLEMTARIGNETSERLTLKEYQILSLFLTKNDHRLSRREIVEAIWQDCRVCPQVLNVHLKHLRHKISGLKLTIRYNRLSYQLERDTD